MSGSEAFGGGYVKIRLRTESKSLPITRRNLRLQITIKVLMWPLKVPHTVKACISFYFITKGKNSGTDTIMGKFLRGTKTVK